MFGPILSDRIYDPIARDRGPVSQKVMLRLREASAVLLGLGALALGSYPTECFASDKGGDGSKAAAQGCTMPTSLKPGMTFRECPHFPEMVVIPAGHFTMGLSDDGVEAVDEFQMVQSEVPAVKVAVKHAFALAKFPVTFEEWDYCVQSGGCEGYLPDDHGWGRGNRPVINVSWADALTYIRWLNRAIKIDSDSITPYRLPTEAQWEYAARAGTTTARWWGNKIGKNNTVCDGCGSHWDNTETAPIGSFRPNRFGLFDMLGNVVEWTMDCWTDSHDRAPADASAIIGSTEQCDKRVTKGSMWNSPPGMVRAAFRWPGETNVQYSRSSAVGFRVLRDLDVDAANNDHSHTPSYQTETR
jgi:formylglycine-generating enzyme required for sulfatase activity